MNMNLPPGVSSNPVTRSLHVSGTAGDDSLKVSRDETAIRLEINQRVTLVPAENIDTIVVEGLGGNDEIEVRDDREGSCRKQVAFVVDGGEGDDSLSAQGRSSLSGGAGDDDIYAEGKRNQINGGPGDDFVFAKGKRNQIEGGPGEDYAQRRSSMRDFWLGHKELD